MLMDCRPNKDENGKSNLVRPPPSVRSGLATSEGRDWRGVRVDACGPLHADRADPLPPRDHPVVLIARDHSSYVLQQRAGQHVAGPWRPGDVSIVPAGLETTFRGHLPSHLRIGLSPDHLVEAAEALGRQGVYVGAELKNVFRTQDPVIGKRRPQATLLRVGLVG
ncbi:hypothetical protein [Ancylobacter lacus]|uniref:hypothetical protein n=1 Tax=Ancylobacter lacus TaxID=2579970 RepID=UPI001BCBEBD0|nr:hypothetical protein [Ancylobacter lacus]MBS7540218.1 hypothetical protein [Ancylobacter lacus]